MSRGSCRWALGLLLTLVASWADPAIAQVTTGVWWSSAEPGRGYVVEVSGSRAMWAVLGYRDGGTAAWYTTSGSLFTSSIFFGDLAELGGGQTLSSPAKAPTTSTSVGNLSFTATSSSQGALILPGGRQVTLQRYEFVGGGISLGRSSAAPETGWWWNASEAGRGYFIDVQGTRLFVVLMMYEADGTSRWYSATGELTIGPFGLSPTTTATLEEYAGGPTLTGAFTVAARSAVHGQITLSFSSTTAGTLMLPSGTAIAITRFTGF
jgi:hypothetical protein